MKAKFGVVVGICTDRDSSQRDSIESIAAMSRPDTPLIALFNGVDSFPINPRYEVVHYPRRMGREQGVWRWALSTGMHRGWDWVHAPHDDFHWLEPGWEDFVERAASTHRIGMASDACWSYLRADKSPGGQYTFVSGDKTEHGVPQVRRPDGFLGVAMDGCSLCFNVTLFARRGEVTPVQALSGYGEMEAGLWCLQQGYACARIFVRGTHHPGATSNTRSALNIPVEGIQETALLHLERLPAVVLDADRIRVGGRVLDVRRGVPAESAWSSV